MSRTRPLVLLTRPIAQAQSFAATLEDADTLLSPLMRIVPMAVSIDLEKFDAVIFTSRNGVDVLADQANLRGLRAYAVGDATAERARRHGMQVSSAAGNAGALVDMIRHDRIAGRLLHVHGQHTRGEVAQRLKSYGIDTESAMIYTQERLPLTADARAAFKGQRPIIIPLFSPRTSALLSAELEDSDVVADLTVIGISPAVLQAWTGPAAKEMVAVEKPSATEIQTEILRRLRGLS